MEWIDNTLKHIPYAASVFEFDSLELVGGNPPGYAVAERMVAGHDYGNDPLEDLMTPFGLAVGEVQARLSAASPEPVWFEEFGDLCVVGSKIPTRGYPRPDLVLSTVLETNNVPLAIAQHRRLGVLLEMNETVATARLAYEQTLNTLMAQTINLEFMAESVTARIVSLMQAGHEDVAPRPLTSS
jgi:hypothetical protein